MNLMQKILLLFSVAAGLNSTVKLVAAEKTASHTFVPDGVKLHYLTAGKGPPVVLIHGLASSAEMNWKLPGLIDELAKDHQVIALDLPGHGRSDKPEKDAAYGRQVVEDVVLLLDHLKIKQAQVVGYSIGGMVTMKLLATHPDRVSSAVIGGMGWLQDGSGLQKFWERLGGRGGTRNSAGFLHGISEFALTEAELKKIKVPVKVIVGDRDPCQKMYVVPLQKVRTDWPVVEIPDAGHFNCLVKPEFKQELAAWVREHDPEP